MMVNNEQPELPQQPITLCPECQNGVLSLQYLTYFTWLNDELVTVPNFPAWVCNVCGRRENDQRAILWLNTLLSPDAGQRHNRMGPRPQAKTQRPQP